MVRCCVLAGLLLAGFLPALAEEGTHQGLDALIAKHAQANGIPEALVHRVIQRESGYDARAIGKGGTFGLMQIKHATARGMGYTGETSGLLDPDTNLTFAVRYLAGAYRAADGDADQAVSYFSRGYYGVAKRKRLDPDSGRPAPLASGGAVTDSASATTHRPAATSAIAVTLR
jgi:soluble lytic murein transglycosylase-like protein